MWFGKIRDVFVVEMNFEVVDRILIGNEEEVC